VFAWTWKILQWPVVVALVAAGAALVYYIAPDVQQRLIWIAPGSVFATTVWVLISLGFKWYVSAFATYQKTYGAIGGVIVALLWLYVSGLAILMGAEMNAVIEHASHKDTLKVKVTVQGVCTFYTCTFLADSVRSG
jgi:membrane protein